MLSFLLFAPLALAVPTPGSIAISLSPPKTVDKHFVPGRYLAKRRENLTDWIDAVYYGNGTIGNSTFQFLFDTGSSDVFVPDPECPFFQCSGEHYNRGGKNLNKTLTLSYGSGEVGGYMYQDAVTIDGFTSHNQTFISAAEDTLLQYSGANGLIGLAFAPVAKTNSTPFFDNLIRNGEVEKPEFGIYYGRDEDGTGSDSEIVLGGRNPEKFTGPISEFPVVQKYWWTLGLDEVKINGECAGNATRGYAAIDSGTQNIVAPKAAAAAIFAAIPGGKMFGNSSVGGFLDHTTAWVYPCNTSAKYMPSLVFGGKEFALDVKDLMAGEVTDAGPGYCSANIFGQDVVNQGKKVWIVGDVFLRSWYAIFNHKGKGGVPTVSFAKSVQKK